MAYLSSPVALAANSGKGQGFAEGRSICITCCIVMCYMAIGQINMVLDTDAYCAHLDVERRPVWHARSLGSQQGISQKSSPPFLRRARTSAPPGSSSSASGGEIV